ncbi:transcriptional regulator [Aureimonas flava]|uniref:Transcriptional regulator n=1 Tax=Aureimonas flava TaxID=2320271 RepID=A0A3A1WI50_9HYPH|nr:metalloregulator ArsR/SmtB family transcription factor [Aureimonas flava]RIY00264.1 transcriptional regulator [Aureimonas flava]
MTSSEDRETQIKALASEARLAILRVLADPKTHFAHQRSADPVEVGVCMTLIAEALGVAQPTASRHLHILRQAKFVTVRRHLKWSYCQRDDRRIQEHLDWLSGELLPKR